MLRPERVSGGIGGIRGDASVRSPTRILVVARPHTREVMSPQRPDLVLAADIPDIELCVLVCDGLDVESDGGNGGYVLVELEFVEDCWRGRVSRGP